MRYVSKEQIRYGIRKLNKKIQENPNRNKEKNLKKQKEASHNENRCETIKNSRRWVWRNVNNGANSFK